MRPAAKCAIVNIKLREARDIRPTPDDEQLNAFQHQPFTEERLKIGDKVAVF